jgi:hypothetical protein
MSEICGLIKHKLNEYGYEIYEITETSYNREFCIMAESVMIFVNELEKSLTLSFECTLEPEKVAQRIMVINEIDEVSLVYISESYIFDKVTEKYIVGDHAKQVACEMEQSKLLKEITRKRLYCHILKTQKCHEC